jgi:hypothetical protein
MHASRVLKTALLLALLLTPLAAHAAPASSKPKPSIVTTLRQFLGDLEATLTAWIGQHGSGIDPFGNHTTVPPPTETSGFASSDDQTRPRLEL